MNHCTMCRGTGKVKCTCFGQLTCKICGGTGIKDCPRCKGEQEKMSVKIEPGCRYVINFQKPVDSFTREKLANDLQGWLEDESLKFFIVGGHGEAQLIKVENFKPYVLFSDGVNLQEREFLNRLKELRRAYYSLQAELAEVNEKRLPLERMRSDRVLSDFRAKVRELTVELNTIREIIVGVVLGEKDGQDHSD